MAEISYSRKKIVINDEYGTWFENQDVKGLTGKYNSETNTLTLTTSKKREAPRQIPEDVVTTKQSEGVYMRFVRQSRGYAFKMTVNTDNLIDRGEETLVEEFEMVIHEFLEKMKAQKK